MKVFKLGLAALAVGVTMLACSLGGTSSTSPTAPAATQPQQPAASLQPANTPSVGLQPQATSAGTALNPCDIVPQDEASTLANFQFDAGTVEANSGSGSRCVYGSQSTNVMTVNVAQASDAATAQAYRDAFIADIQSQAAQIGRQRADGHRAAGLPGRGGSGDAQLLDGRRDDQRERLWVSERGHLRGDQRCDQGSGRAHGSGVDG